MNITFNKNVLAGFAISLALLLISSVASYVSISNLLASFGWVNHTNTVIRELEAVISSLKDGETGQRGYLLSGDPKFLEPYEGARNEVFQHISKVKELTVDNKAQQEGCARLQELVAGRMLQLQVLIDRQRKGHYRPADLVQGRRYMEEARLLVEIMQEREQQLLEQRTQRMNRFALFTPALIIAATVLAILITVFFYIRVRNDFGQRVRLQRALEEKDADITHRINVIRGVANRISGGDYSIRVSDTGKDGLGDLSFSLNKMAASLDDSFHQLAERDWLQTGVNGLSKIIAGEQDVHTLSRNIITFVAEYTSSQVGSLYLLKEDHTLELTGSYALSEAESRKHIALGAGIVGQSAADRKIIHLQDIPGEYIRVSFAAADIRPKSLIAIPIIFEDSLKGVMEIGTVHDYPDNVSALLEQITERVGIALNTTWNRIRLQELFEETQAQAEELQMQHTELESLNTELEAQAQKLQASEEELKVQQEELLQTNQELEERSHLLEERNQEIIERNLAVQRHAAQLELSTKYKSEFLANMSHELRTPLNSILLLSRLLSENHEQNLTGEQVEYASVIQSSGQGLLALINEILDLSKIEAGKMELEYAEVPLAEITGDLQGLFRPLAQERQLEFRVSTRPEVPASIYTDKQRLEQILKNLLSNAIKFTAEGHVHLDISLPADGRPFVQFAVSDTGIGIASDQQQAVFEAFRQADGSTRRKYGGTGLGLSISRELARLLGGEIHVSSTPDEGSVFTVYVPVEKPAAAAYAPEPAPGGTPDDTDNTGGSAGTGDPLTLTEIPDDIPDDRSHTGAHDKTVLIVEDDTGFAKALLDFTRKQGYKAIVSVRGDEAIALAQQYRPLAILLDIQLPVKNGWEVMEALKGNPATRHIPVHIMSSFEARRKSLTEGAVDFINKPVALEQLHEAFRKLEQVIGRQHKKVLITEENTKHARALAYFLETFDVQAAISTSVSGSLEALHSDHVDCVILDMGVPAQQGYEMLEAIRKNADIEELPIIVFTGRNLSMTEAQRLRQYADSIVMKTAHSYQRILDEVSLFLHLVEENRSHPGGSGGERPGSLAEVLQQKTILITDDDVRNIYSLTRTLEKYRMKVLSATDGREALRVLGEHPETDIILMDIMMPEMDGYEAMRQIRRTPALAHLPIIAVTAKAMTGDREKCVQAGASDYISKPVDTDQLLSLLRVWLYEKA